MEVSAKRVGLAVSPNVPHFIGSWILKPYSLCEQLIEFFESHPENQSLGKTAGGFSQKAKNSTDLTIRPRELDHSDHKPVRLYLDALYDCYHDYLEQWPFLQSVLPRAQVSSFNIQRYDPGGHFLKVHSERTTLATSHRILAWMTYLNDVAEGGGTQFVHQNLTVQPERGKTLIWPAEWTHAHKGNVLDSGVKYIITGWMHFPPTALDSAAT
ncbi:MAG: 2OG-Fe(II) oxygenase [Gammaproteobacteria bacterium]|nr:2OG-Fe(II) oxygenase [Gammaproteobacteria bacterium]